MAEFFTWIALLALAAVSERVLAARRPAAAEVSPAGRLSDVLVQTATVVAIAGPPISAAILQLRPGPVSAWLGAAVAGCGLLLRTVAMRRLGRRYLLTPGPIPAHIVVIADGPYAVVRHPGYSGLLLYFVGLALLTGGPVGSLFTLPLIGGTLVRIRLEERMLVEELGNDYLEYAEVVRWKLVPRIL